MFRISHQFNRMMEWKGPATLFTLLLIVILSVTKQCLAIQCYECDSNSNRGCGENLDSSTIFPIDCDFRGGAVGGGGGGGGGGVGSRITMCKKSKQKDTGLIVRRCATRFEQNNQVACNWGNDDIGRYAEQCYCITDRCNGASTLHFAGIFALFPLALIKYYGLI